MTGRLIAEFAGTHPAGTVMRRVARVQEAGRRRGVNDVAGLEQAVRTELLACAPAHAVA